MSCNNLFCCFLIVIKLNCVQALEFSKWWLCEFKTIKFPAEATVFSVYIDQDTKKLALWKDRVPKFELDPEVPLLVMSFNHFQPMTVQLM